jgi:hypothetical protein
MKVKYEMEIIETSIFTKRIIEILKDDEYKALQNFLCQHPKSGDLIRGSGGLRKLRWNLQGSGKSGGIRNIYYFFEDENTILMVFVYKKSETENLTQKQIEALRKAFL